MAVDCTSGVGCSTAPDTRTTPRPPRRVGTGGGGAGIGYVRFGRAGLDCEFSDRPPVMDLARLRGYGTSAGPVFRRCRRNRLAEQVAAGAGRDRYGLHRQARRSTRDDGVEQFAGIGGASLPVDGDTGLGATLDYGQTGVEAGAPAGIGRAHLVWHLCPGEPDAEGFGGLDYGDAGVRKTGDRVKPLRAGGEDAGGGAETVQQGFGESPGNAGGMAPG